MPPTNDPDAEPRATELLGTAVNDINWSSLGVEPEWRPAGPGVQCVEFWSDATVAQIVAWDHAFCLDIQLIDVATSESEYLCVGPCDGAAVYSSKLRDGLDEIVGRLRRERDQAR